MKARLVIPLLALPLLFLGCSSKTEKDPRITATHTWPSPGIEVETRFTPGGHIIKFLHRKGAPISDIACRYISPGGNTNDWVDLPAESAGKMDAYVTIFNRPKGTGVQVRYTKSGEQQVTEAWVPFPATE